MRVNTATDMAAMLSTIAKYPIVTSAAAPVAPVVPGSPVKPVVPVDPVGPVRSGAVMVAFAVAVEVEAVSV